MDFERKQKIQDAIAILKNSKSSKGTTGVVDEELSLLSSEIEESIKHYESKLDEWTRLFELSERVNNGDTLDSVLDHVYESFSEFIPYDRIGFSLLEEDGQKLASRWFKSKAEDIHIKKDYWAKMAGSSLQIVLESKKPRIINDLEAYLKDNPDSDSTKKIVKEGMRSSLTCPLIANGKAIGFMFFSSMKPETYKEVHTETFRQIAGLLATIVEGGKRYQEIAELNELKNRFLGIAAHDLRSPISVFRNYLGLFLNGYLGKMDEKQTEIMGKMDKGAQGMIMLIDNVLDISAIESGKVDLKKDKINFGEFMLAMYEDNRMLAENKNIGLNLEMPDDMPVVEFDRGRLTQVVNNLASNAIKFSKENTSITLIVGKNKNGVSVAVKDQGPGIPKADMDKLFGAFSKTSVRPTAGEKSTGLGLSIVKKMIDVHGGEVNVESEVGIGSTFTFSLPMK